MWLAWVLFALAWMLLTLGCILLASAFTNSDSAGFSRRDPKPRPRNVGCLAVVLAIVFAAIATVIAVRWS